MTLDKMEFADGEPPSTARLDASGELVDRVMAVAHLPPMASVAASDTTPCLCFSR